MIGPMITSPLPMVVEAMNWVQFNNLAQFLHPNDAVPPYYGRPGWVWLTFGDSGENNWFLMKVF